jgi:hypothetical protein
MRMGVDLIFRNEIYTSSRIFIEYTELLTLSVAKSILGLHQDL